MIQRHAIGVRRGIDLHHSECSRDVELGDFRIDLLAVDCHEFLQRREGARARSYR